MEHLHNRIYSLDLARGVTQRYLPNVRLFAHEVPTHLGILHEAGHQDPWIIAMNCPPTQATVRDDASRWCIEPTFSDFKRRGFQLEATQLQAPDRLDRLVLIMALAMHWCVRAGQEEARQHPTPLEKKPRNRPIPTIGPLRKSDAACSPGLNAVYGRSKDGSKCTNPYPPSTLLAP